MSGPDDEFDDFLSRRKPLFGRGTHDGLEPPPELDRIVLRQAREAIEVDRPQRVFSGARWGAPLALAATLLLGFAAILNVGLPKKAPVPEVTVQAVSQELDERTTAAPAAPAATFEPSVDRARADVADNEPRAERRAAADASGPVVVDLGASAEAKRDVAASAPPALVSQAEAERYAPAPPAMPAARSAGNLAAGSSAGASMASSRSVVSDVQPPSSEARQAMAKASSVPAWRRDTASWLAEIERLRAAGKTAEADAELAEYKREHRAYAVAPDR